ncbi:peptidase S8/S53 domain-containing protein [Phyllosticta citribraziliensis]
MSQDIQMELCEQVMRGKTLQNRLPPDRDVDGHGSECAYLLTRVTPFAQILSYRIAEKITDDIEPAIVAEALRHAIHGRRQGVVDIISMSFGIKPTQDIRNLLNEAKGKGILMFAASSNDGGPRIKFPANSDDVFAIDAANRTGGPSFDNPGALQKPYRFTALGEILSLRGSMEGSQRRREVIPGSSFATPVAAATAAAILEFARQPPLSYDPLALKGLKMLEGMRAVFIHLLSTKKSAGSEFNHINIEHFEPMNNNKERWDEGGECDDWNSDRYQAADSICKRLKNALDDDYGQAMNDQIAKNHREKWTRESEEQRRKEREAWEETVAKQREDEEKKQEEINRTKKKELKRAFKDAVERIYPS